MRAGGEPDFRSAVEVRAGGAAAAKTDPCERKRVSLFYAQLFLCLSRAYLGKYSLCLVSNGLRKKDVYLQFRTLGELLLPLPDPINHSRHLVVGVHRKRQP